MTTTPQPGARTLGKYRLLRRLGAGGMGIVFLAEDPDLQRRVALKVLGGPLSHNHALVQRFLREARAAAQLSHPNVVPVFDVNLHGRSAYLVMELQAGGSLDAWLAREGAFPWNEAIQLAAQAGRGLAAAHAAGLIHRDVKPGNLLLAADGTVKVADFGLVKVLDPTASSISTPSNVVGTPHYMSPEQCRGESLDERSDVYSLGATLYHLLTGRVMYDADGTGGVLFAHCSGSLPDPRAHAPLVPESVVKVLHRAVAKARYD